MSTPGTRLAPRQSAGSKRRRGAADAAPPAQSRRKNQGMVELPSVNLLSPSAFERIAVRRLRIQFGAGCLALIALAAAIWAFQATRVGDAEKELAVEKADTARLTERTNVLQPVKTFIAGVEQQMATVAQTMSSEIYFSKVLAAMADAAPTGLRVDSFVVTLAPPPVVAAPPADGGTNEDGQAPPAPVTPSACPGPDPFKTQVVIGCITLSGTASSRATVGDLVVALGADRTFVEPFISTTTTADASKVSFSGSVGLSEKAFSGRYAKLLLMLAGKD